MTGEIRLEDRREGREPAPGGVLVTHNGGDPGFSADLLRFVDDRAFLVVLANDRAVEAFDISGALAQILFGEAKRYDIDHFIRTGVMKNWQPHPIPQTPALAAEKRRLVEANRQLREVRSHGRA